VFSAQIFQENSFMKTKLNFSQLSKSVFRSNFSGKLFHENQAKFFFDWKVFSVDQLF
jgi:hypothetical protein